jgi:hypothetical protein
VSAAAEDIIRFVQSRQVAFQWLSQSSYVDIFASFMAKVVNQGAQMNL